VAAQEATVLGALKGHVESLSMNSVEAPMLVHRLHAAGLSSVDEDPHLGRDIAEDPAAMINGAGAIKAALGLERVHLHGLYGDFIVVDAFGSSGTVDIERTRLALLRARQLASMKAANDTGEIKSKDDIFDVAPVVDGKGLAAVQRFADAMQQLHGLDNDARDAIVRDWCYVDKQGVATFFVPSRGIHDRTGGTVSLGDTIDASALVFSRHEGRPKEHHQLTR
jgi:ADP-dependent phosphofructokinase/glucokinase